MSESNVGANRGADPGEGVGEADAVEPTFGQKVWEQVVTFGLAIAIAVTIRACVIEPFRIPSGSMLPTLLIGDHLFVNKFVYGVKIPFTDIRLPGLREPERGDVVVFSVARKGDAILPADKEAGLRRDDFVKRIVGMPGDRIEVNNGRVIINGEPLEVLDLERGFRDEMSRNLSVSVEKLGECEHVVLANPIIRGHIPDSSFVVPEGRYFMMGDNRDFSRDSRDWGTVRKAEFKGPAFILYWSWNRNGDFRDFLNPVNWFVTEKRWDRILSAVDCGVEIEEIPQSAAGGSG